MFVFFVNRICYIKVDGFIYFRIKISRGKFESFCLKFYEFVFFFNFNVCKKGFKF